MDQKFRSFQEISVEKIKDIFAGGLLVSGEHGGRERYDKEVRHIRDLLAELNRFERLPQEK